MPRARAAERNKHRPALPNCLHVESTCTELDALLFAGPLMQAVVSPEVAK